MAQWVMANVLRLARVTILTAAAAVAYPGAGAATLYKSVDKEGHVTFSDNPVDGAVIDADFKHPLASPHPPWRSFQRSAKTR